MRQTLLIYAAANMPVFSAVADIDLTVGTTRFE